MLLVVDHITRYVYDPPIRAVVQSHRLTPSIFDGQKTLNWKVTVSDGQIGGGFRDGAGDWIQGWSVLGPVSEVTVHVQGEVETTDTTGVLRGYRETVPPECYLQDTMLTEADTALVALTEGLSLQGAGAEDDEGALDALSLAHALAAKVAEAISYTPGATEAATTAAEALAKGEGVCQDHAHALIAVARHLGLPARYVSGYLLADGEGKAHDAAHAWAEIHVKGLGWVGFDASNACCPDERYIRLGSGLDARDAAPIKGISRGVGQEILDVSVRVQVQQ